MTLVSFVKICEALEVVSNPGDSLHSQPVPVNGGAGADRDAEHGAHDHLLDQLLAEVDGAVFVVVGLDQAAELIELVLGELDLRLVVVQSLH